MENIRFALRKIAERKAFFDSDYEEDVNNIIEEWNKLVPVASKSGISHDEMVSIWEGVEWGEYLDHYNNDYED